MAVGWILVALGVAFVLLGLIAAVREVMRADMRERGTAADPEAWAKLFTALTELVKIAPLWFLLVLVGLVMVFFGSTRI